MKTLVVFDTKHGTTRDIAQKLAMAIGDGTETFELGSGGKPELGKFDAVVLGGPVYAGTWSRRAKGFARDNEAALAKKRFAAFSSGTEKKDAASILKASLPPGLSGASVSLAGLGGAMVMARMNAFERFIIKKVAKTTSDTSTVDEGAILELAKSMKKGSK